MKACAEIGLPTTTNYYQLLCAFEEAHMEPLGGLENKTFMSGEYVKIYY